MESKSELGALLASEAADPVEPPMGLVPDQAPWTLRAGEASRRLLLDGGRVGLFYLADFRKLSVADRQALLVALSSFAQADGIVMENVSANYMQKVALPEAHYFYAMHMAMEAIHSEAYALMLDLYVSQEVDRAKVLHVVTEMPSVQCSLQAKNAWGKKQIGAEAPVGVLLLAFSFSRPAACRLMSCSSFALIFFRMRGLLPGLSQANDFIT